MTIPSYTGKKSSIKKLYMHLTEDILKKNPNMCNNEVRSLNARQDILIQEVHKLGQKAASNAIDEWGRPKSEITHLIFCSSSSRAALPGADFQLVNLLDLKPSTKRFMIHNQAGNAGGTALRLAKDLAKNNANGRALLVCSDITVGIFRAPSKTSVDNLVGQSLFGDGASAAVIGCINHYINERSLFHVVSASQTTIPSSEFAVQGHLREEGYIFGLAGNLPEKIAENLGKSLIEAFGQIGISDWNSLFWIVHPVGPRILNLIEAKVGLKPEKLRASRHVLGEYGNVWGSTLLFMLDEMIKRSMEEAKDTTGEGLNWGVLFGFGPGLTVETIVLHSTAINVHE